MLYLKIYYNLICTHRFKLLSCIGQKNLFNLNIESLILMIAYHQVISCFNYLINIQILLNRKPLSRLNNKLVRKLLIGFIIYYLVWDYNFTQNLKISHILMADKFLFSYFAFLDQQAAKDKIKGRIISYSKDKIE